MRASKGILFNRFLLAHVILLSILWTAPVLPAQPEFPNADFKVLKPDGSGQFGRAHFSLVTQKDGLLHARGQYRYFSGDYDVDEAWLKAKPDPTLPALVRYRHVFYHRDASIERVNEADLTSGQASCSVYGQGSNHTESGKLDFPADTYAGPGLLFPIRAFLRGSLKTGTFHNFNCSPGPRIYAIKIFPNAPARWELYPTDVIEVDIKPDFGILDLVIAPFIPRVRLWFDSVNDSELVGVESVRYYKGSSLLMVRETPPRSEDRIGLRHSGQR